MIPTLLSLFFFLHYFIMSGVNVFLINEQLILIIIHTMLLTDYRRITRFRVKYEGASQRGLRIFA